MLGFYIAPVFLLELAILVVSRLFARPLQPVCRVYGFIFGWRRSLAEYG